ncbi:MAG: DUF1565 domain-containing protein [Lysobacteraceae bacterium]|nr:MAG: DUF1565 domain-containing protein [Xanthomonadaceae bacterium]
MKTPTSPAPILVVLSSLACSATAFASPSVTYHVSPNGSDSADGSESAPFKTLTRAARAVTRPGTTVLVAPGIYEGGIRTTAHGSPQARITWMSSTKGGAKIVPPAMSKHKTAWDNRGNHVSIIGFEVDGSRSGDGKLWTGGIYTGGSYSVIEGNHVHHIAQAVPCNRAGGSGIGVDSYFRGVKGDVIGNTVHDIGPAGCRFVQGIYHSTSGTIKNNVVYRIGSAAIHLWHDAKDLAIINNTVSASVSGIIVGGGNFYYSATGAKDVHVHNNIVYDNQYGISEQGRTGASNTYKNNLVYKNKVDWRLRNRLVHTGTIGTDPLLVDYSRIAPTPNFRPSASSPAIGRGIATYAPPSDIDGRLHDAARGVDVGAYRH